MPPGFAGDNYADCLGTDAVLCSECGLRDAARCIALADGFHLRLSQFGKAVPAPSQCLLRVQSHPVAIPSRHSTRVEAIGVIVPSAQTLRMGTRHVAFSPGLSRFPHHIGGVLLTGTQEQMGGIDAPPIAAIAGGNIDIAGVADKQARGDRSVVQFPRIDVRPYMAPLHAETAVAVARSGGPKPAAMRTRGLIYPCPEALWKGAKRRIAASLLAEASMPSGKYRGADIETGATVFACARHRAPEVMGTARLSLHSETLFGVPRSRRRQPRGSLFVSLIVPVSR